MKNIVVLGGGYGGTEIINTLLKTNLDSDVKITLVDKLPYHTLKTEFYALAAGTASDKDLRVSFSESEKVEKVFDEVISVDLESKTVMLKGGTLSYDYLVIGLGCEDNYHGISGAKEYTYSIQSMEKARITYEKINNLSPYAHVAVIGGGLSGVEVASELRESRRDLAITIYDRNDSVLSPFKEKVKKYATSWFKKRKVNIVTNAAIDYVEEGIICNNGSCTKIDAIIWTAGIQPNKVVRNLNVEKDERGRIVLNEYHQVKTHTDVFVVGDCASLPYAPSAQVAEHQGVQIAKIIFALLNEKEPEVPGELKLRGVLGSLGKKHGFGVVYDTALTGIIPRYLKTGVLWASKHR